MHTAGYIGYFSAAIFLKSPICTQYIWARCTADETAGRKARCGSANHRCGRLGEAKTILADELTALVHGADEAKKAKAGTVVLSAGGAASMPGVRDRQERRE